MTNIQAQQPKPSQNGEHNYSENEMYPEKEKSDSNAELQDLTVHDLNDLGEGVAKTDSGQVVFVPRTIPGDQIRAEIKRLRKNIWTADQVQLIIPSISRQTAFCPAFSERCGGCEVQELDYEKLTGIKQKQVREKLIRLAQLNPEKIRFEPIKMMREPFGYRNHVQLKVQYNDVTNNFERGFFTAKSHRIVPHQVCPISQTSDSAVWSGLLEFLSEQPEISRQLRDTWTECVIRTGEHTGEVMIGFVLSDGKQIKQLATEESLFKRLAERIQEQFKQGQEPIGLRRNLVSIWLLDETNARGDCPVFGQKRFTEQILGKRFEIGPRSFFQVNTKQAEEMYQCIAELLQEQPIETLYDLYCGTGAIGISLSAQAKQVKGVDLWSGSIDNAIDNATLNGIPHALFEKGKAEDWIGRQTILSKDVILVDPPRRGLERKLIDALNQTSAERFVYVSCHPGTLARDIKLLSQSWQVQAVQPIDLFPWTMHVETVVLMSRKG